ncbi:hypothetical protein [Caldanaerobacter subterraneus]|nr:hypothetical protein [Caldanaerobacter subterraneus]
MTTRAGIVIKIITIRAKTLQWSRNDIHLMAGRTKELRTKIQ